MSIHVHVLLYLENKQDSLKIPSDKCEVQTWAEAGFGFMKPAFLG